MSYIPTHCLHYIVLIIMYDLWVYSCYFSTACNDCLNYVSDAQGQIRDLKKEGAQEVRGLAPKYFFYQFRGLLKEFGVKTYGRGPPVPPSGSAPDA